MKNFNVIIWDPNKKEFVPYDIIPYFVNSYKQQLENSKKYPKSDYWKVPKTFEEFKNFVNDEGLYQFWGRCEYEIILVDWPCQQKQEKIDVYKQIKMNLDLITQLVMESI